MVNTFLCTTCLMPKISSLKSSSLVYCSSGNNDKLSTEGFFTFKRSTCITLGSHTLQWGVSISEVDFLWESVDWTSNKCSLSTLMGVYIKGVEFRDNLRVFPGQNKENVHNNKESIKWGLTVFLLLYSWAVKPFSLKSESSHTCIFALT